MAEIHAIGIDVLKDLATHAELNSHSSFYDYEIVLFDAENYLGRNIPPKKSTNISSEQKTEIYGHLQRRKNQLEEYAANGGIVIYFPFIEKNFNSFNLQGGLESFILSDLMFVAKPEISTGKKFVVGGNLDKSIQEFFNEIIEILSYRVILPEVGKLTPCLFVQGSNRIVGSYLFNEKGGGIIFSPVFSPNSASDIHRYHDSLQKLVLNLRKTTSTHFVLPEWHTKFMLPGEQQAGSEIEEVNTKLAEMQILLEKVIQKKEEIESLKNLIASTGTVLEDAVKRALNEMGLQVKTGPEGRDDLIGTHDNLPIVIEIKGRDKKGAAEADASQLEKWVSNYQIENDVYPKAILIMNGYAGLPLDERLEPVFPNQMLKYSVDRGHSLISGLQLLCMYLEAGEYPEKQKAAIAELLTNVGVYPKYLGDEWKEIIKIVM